jgi:hypothetical protein
VLLNADCGAVVVLPNADCGVVVVLPNADCGAAAALPNALPVAAGCAKAAGFPANALNPPPDDGVTDANADGDCCAGWEKADGWDGCPNAGCPKAGCPKAEAGFTG